MDTINIDSNNNYYTLSCNYISSAVNCVSNQSIKIDTSTIPTKRIVLPCDIGDTVYRLKKKCVVPRTVKAITYKEHNGFYCWVITTTTDDILGETVFLNKQQAEFEFEGKRKGW